MGDRLTEVRGSLFLLVKLHEMGAFALLVVLKMHIGSCIVEENVL